MLYILQCSIIFYRILLHMSSKIRALNIFISDYRIFGAFSYYFLKKGEVLWTFIENFPSENSSLR